MGTLLEDDVPFRLDLRRVETAPHAIGLEQQGQLPAVDGNANR
ncbi:MAG: hypothetical protein U0794_02570 [Isosphaeraceae bacterium]